MASNASLAVRAGALVREKRESAGMTAEELAKRAGLSNKSRILKIEHGQAATLKNLDAIARALGVELKDLLP